jgi:hypothetical protein
MKFAPNGAAKFADDECEDQGHDCDEPEFAEVEHLEMNNQLEREIFFQTKGVGSVKSIGGVDVYVKSEHCESSLKQLIKHLRTDSPKFPIIKEILGKWSFIQTDLLQLLVFHQQDRKLAFITLMLLV